MIRIKPTVIAEQSMKTEVNSASEAFGFKLGYEAAYNEIKRNAEKVAEKMVEGGMIDDYTKSSFLSGLVDVNDIYDDDFVSYKKV